MKKKKPKKSPSKPPLKDPSPSKSVLLKSVAMDLAKISDLVVSDAQSGLPAGAVAQQSEGDADLAESPVEVSPGKTVIVVSPTDPSSADESSEIVPQSSSAPSQSPSGADQDEPVTFDRNAAPSTSKVLATTESSPVSPRSSSVLAPVELTIGDDKTAPSPILPLPTAEAIVPLSSQLVSVEITSESLTARNDPAKEVNVEVGKLQQANEVKAAPREPAKSSEPPKPDWCAHAKGIGKRLSKKGEAYTLPSGEACIRIPNSVIEKNRKSWEPFVIGQFYSDPPSQGTLHNIVNGIWSKQYKDIVVSKMEGFSFLFRISNAATRNRVINQKLWQIEGQTMFVDKWEPGVVPVKPELTSAPIWLELRKVPFQFFNEDGLERIAGLVGHPEFLHPATANKTNLEVAKVFTIIDPRKPLPEAVNVQFDSGEICRVLVSSPWMPPICELCKEIGHISKRCPKSPKACAYCKSPDHALAHCQKKPRQDGPGKKTRRGRSKDKKPESNDNSNSQPARSAPNDQDQSRAPKSLEGSGSFQWVPTNSPANQATRSGSLQVEVVKNSRLGSTNETAIGETSGSALMVQRELPRSSSLSGQSDVQPDSSDVESSDSELEEGEFSKHEPDFEVVRNRKRFSGQKGKRGGGPKIY